MAPRDEASVGPRRDLAGGASGREPRQASPRPSQYRKARTRRAAAPASRAGRLPAIAAEPSSARNAPLVLCWSGAPGGSGGRGCRWAAAATETGREDGDDLCLVPLHDCGLGPPGGGGRRQLRHVYRLSRRPARPRGRIGPADAGPCRFEHTGEVPKAPPARLGAGLTGRVARALGPEWAEVRAHTGTDLHEPTRSTAARSAGLHSLEESPAAGGRAGGEPT